MTLLIEDSNLRNEFSKAALEKTKAFSVEIVMNQWKSLFENITK